MLSPRWSERSWCGSDRMSHRQHSTSTVLKLRGIYTAYIYAFTSFGCFVFDRAGPPQPIERYFTVPNPGTRAYIVHRVYCPLPGHPNYFISAHSAAPQASSRISSFVYDLVPSLLMLHMLWLATAPRIYSHFNRCRISDIQKLCHDQRTSLSAPEFP